MRRNKCYRYRLSPTPEQEQTFVQWAGCRRFVWNYALERRRQHYQETGKSLPFAPLCLELTALKKELPWLKEADSQCLQQVLRDLDTAYKNFFEKRAGFPKRKKKFRTPNAFRIPQRVLAQGGFCRVPKVGLVPMILHRPLEGDLKSATFKQAPSPLSGVGSERKGLERRARAGGGYSLDVPTVSLRYQHGLNNGEATSLTSL